MTHGDQRLQLNRRHSGIFRGRLCFQDCAAADARRGGDASSERFEKKFNDPGFAIASRFLDGSTVNHVAHREFDEFARACVRQLGRLDDQCRTCRGEACSLNCCLMWALSASLRREPNRIFTKRMMRSTPSSCCAMANASSTSG